MSEINKRHGPPRAWSRSLEKILPAIKLCSSPAPALSKTSPSTYSWRISLVNSPCRYSCSLNLDNMGLLILCLHTFTFAEKSCAAIQVKHVPSVNQVKVKQHKLETQTPSNYPLSGGDPTSLSLFGIKAPLISAVMAPL